MIEGDPVAVEARLERLDGDALAAFVADFWAARGYETTREGRVIFATSGDEWITVGVVGHTRWRTPSLPDRQLDVVVAPGGLAERLLPDGVRLVDATDLRERLWYGFDEAVAIDLCQRHLGASPTDLSPPWSTRLAARLRSARSVLSITSMVGASNGGRGGGGGGGGDEATDGDAGGIGVQPGVALVVLVALVGLVVATGAVAGGFFETRGADRPVAGASATPAAVPTATPAGTATETVVQSFPPGVSESGIENLTALAAAHDRILTNRSYSLWMDVRRPISAGNGRMQRDVDVAVDGDRYLLSASLGTDSDLSLRRAVYYDGRDWAVRDGEGETAGSFTVSGDSEPPMEVPEPFVLRRSMVERYLSTPETTFLGTVIENDRRLYRVTGEGQPAAPELAGVSDYSVSALVDRRGVVHALETRYTVTTAAGPITERFEVTYGQFGQRTVTPPEWYQRSGGNETTADETSTPTE